MPDCIFCQVAAGRTETPILYDDGDVLAFPDLHPQAPLHLLVIPRVHIASTAELGTAHDPLIGKLVRVAGVLARQQGVAQDGYRILTNTNALAGQSVYHLHFHLMAGRPLRWPPG